MIVYLITAAVLVIYIVLVTIFSPEAGTWTFRIVFWLLGILAAGLFLWFYRRKKRAETQPAEEMTLSAEVASLFRQAEARLAQTRLGKRGKISRLPLLILVGEQGAAKTSTVLASKTEPLHLAGQIYEENTVVSTPAANFWLVGETVIAEAGPRLLSDPDAWSTFLRKSRPARLPALLGGQEAPRSAVACVSGEQFLTPEAAETTQVTARNLRARLIEMAQALGIHLPVYVLFNKLDRAPSFLDFARNLTDEEAGKVSGAAVAARQAQQTGVYAEQESRRLSEAFDEVFRSLAEQRLVLLSREHLEEKLPGIYEFPRDLAKLRAPMVRFLVELLKPAQLGTEPFLRGFYFSGVRPVVVGDQAGRRRVPQWLFLPHLFSDVLLADLTTKQAPSASVSTRLGRRLLWAFAAGLLGLYVVLATISFFGNRALVSRAVTAARNTTAPARDPNGLPTAESLTSLENIRLSLAEITVYRLDGRPLRLRWGLYIGDYVYPTVFRLYFDRFRTALFGETHAALLNSLRKLPPRPDPADAYQPAYERLRAYLYTTEIPHCTRRPFLSPVLEQSW
ncbi:MAG: hypothetical protein GY953_21450, partial [bacterium]|nr:hypothetical protein [bacterium]